MKNLVWLVILVALGFGAWKGFQSYQAKYATEQVQSRVEAMLRAYASGDEQSALCQWAEGKPLLPAEVIGARTDSFSSFARSAGLERDMRWSVREVRPGAPAVAVVSVGDRTLELEVSPGTPIVLR